MLAGQAENGIVGIVDAIPCERHVDQRAADGVVGARTIFLRLGREFTRDVFVEGTQRGRAHGGIIIVVRLGPLGLLLVPVQEGAAFFCRRLVGREYHQIVAHDCCRIGNRTDSTLWPGRSGAGSEPGVQGRRQQDHFSIAQARYTSFFPCQKARIMQSSSTLKRLTGLVALLVFALAAFWYWSPFLALRQLQAAAKAGDGPAFNERVDYPRLRESVKAGILGQQAATPSDNVLGSVGRAFGEALVARMIDALVQPDMVMRMMDKGRLKVEGSERDAAEEDDKKDWFSERQGADRLIAWIGKKGQAREERLGLVMERYGFASWRLVGLNMPQRNASAEQPAQ